MTTPSTGDARAEGHQGPICTECGAEFYYDFVPVKHLGTGLCLECYYDRNQRKAMREGE